MPLSAVRCSHGRAACWRRCCSVSRTRWRSSRRWRAAHPSSDCTTPSPPSWSARRPPACSSAASVSCRPPFVGSTGSTPRPSGSTPHGSTWRSWCAPTSSCSPGSSRAAHEPTRHRRPADRLRLAGSNLPRPHEGRRACMEAPTRDPERSMYSIRAVERVCDILSFLQESPRDVALLDVARVANLPKSSTFRYLVTLEERGFVERDPITCSYRAGSAFRGPRAQEPELLTRRARPHLEILESPRTLRLAPRRGDRDPIHSTALGKAIAANLPDEQVRTILAAAGLPQMTPQTITDTDAYLADLAAVRTQGYALDDREHEVDGRCVAVPVLGTAAISLSAPATRLPLRQVTEIAAALQEIALALDGEARHPAA